MTYLKILPYARKGIRAEIDNLRGMQNKCLEPRAGAYSEARTLAQGLQEQIDALEVDISTIDELQDIHDRK